ncbi:MAG: tetratricopeptide repeat protein, partial [bacterium]|nr:tetratricopeptide repeat protein [bacterium]
EEIERDRLHIYLEIAELYMDLKQDKEKAIEYLHTGLDKIADRQLEDFTAKDLKIEYLKRLGSLYREKGNLEKSIEYLNRALEIE